MYIKKNKDGNEYLLANGVWVRNFTKNKRPIDINNLSDTKDYNLLINNEMKNQTLGLPSIDSQPLEAQNVIIVSDGYKFDEKQELLCDLPSNIFIFAVNKALKKWRIHTNNGNKKNINAYIVNNPYENCNSYFSRSMKYFPSCVLSARTNSDFAENYPGLKYEYIPTPSLNFSSNRKAISWYLDDYRNPICAAIGLAYRAKVRKLLLFCCDDLFEDERDGAILLKNGLWQYPQQSMSHSIIDANLHWLCHQEDIEIKVKYHSDGEDYVNANYIKEDKLLEFFSE